MPSLYNLPWSCILRGLHVQVLRNPQQMLAAQGSFSKATSGHGRWRCNKGSWCALGSLLFMWRSAPHEQRIASWQQFVSWCLKHVEILKGIFYKERQCELFDEIWFELESVIGTEDFWKGVWLCRSGRSEQIHSQKSGLCKPLFGIKTYSDECDIDFDSTPLTSQLLWVWSQNTCFISVHIAMATSNLWSLKVFKLYILCQ